MKALKGIDEVYVQRLHAREALNSRVAEICENHFNTGFVLKFYHS